jgi:excisionase family DNA binding protein
MGLRQSKPEQGGGTERWLEVDASMTGSLTFKDAVNLQINGRFDGTLETKGVLAIGEKAQVKATIHGEMITVGGTVNGNITATTRVELLATARVTGKITSPRVVMQDGAVLQGALEMGTAAPAQGSGRWMTVDELARYLEVDAGTVSQWAQGGRLPAQREGAEWRFDRSRIEEWLAQEKVK